MHEPLPVDDDDYLCYKKTIRGINLYESVLSMVE